MLAAILDLFAYSTSRCSCLYEGKSMTSGIDSYFEDFTKATLRQTLDNTFMCVQMAAGGVETVLLPAGYCIRYTLMAGSFCGQQWR